ncbi:MAG: fatty acyl-AMP ligase [Planctomycetaceae bacterium]
MPSFSTILEEAAAQSPDKRLFVFPETRSRPAETLTYGDLASHARAAAYVLALHARRGDRAVLMFPTGSAFWEAFFGCLAHGVIAVPVNIPNLNRSSEMLRQVCRDCSPAVLMTDSRTADLLQRRADRHPWFDGLRVITPDDWRGNPGCAAIEASRGSETAFLQYTSGSTARPKGVQVSHDNLLANAEMIRRAMGIRTGGDIGVTWLPHYHDMGLVGSYLETLFTRNTTWCLQPEDFVLNPAMWLRLISEHQAGICGGPDFAYRLCFEKCGADEIGNIDLSSWRVAYIGAERIREQTLHRFSEKFAAAGFRKSAFFPCYGLGEATLLATGGPAESDPVIRSVSVSALGDNLVLPPKSDADTIRLVGSGSTIDGCRVMILDSVSLCPLDDEHVGEIFLSGASVTDGCFHDSAASEAVLRALTPGGTSQRYLRTGDLGFVSAGQLFVTGRTREIIIVRGRNLYPDDIEQHISQAHDTVEPGGIAAFGVDVDGQESLVIAAELRRTAVNLSSPESVMSKLRHLVTEGFGISPADILLLRPASIPRTSSGKLKRVELRNLYSAGTLESLFRQNSEPAGGQ